MAATLEVIITSMKIQLLGTMRCILILKNYRMHGVFNKKDFKRHH